MRIGDVIKQYRDEHGETQRSMAMRLGCSFAYVAMLESGINSKTGKEVKPSIDIFIALARLLGTDVDGVLRMVDGDQPVVIPPRYSDERLELIHLAESLPERDVPEAVSYLSYLAQKAAADARRIEKESGTSTAG